MPYREETIGNCRLILGDSREIIQDFPDKSIDFIFTDPPYGHANNNNDLAHKREVIFYGAETVEEPRPIINDNRDESDALYIWLFSEANRLLDAGCCLACCCPGGGPNVTHARIILWLDELFGHKQTVVWHKSGFGPGMGWHYRRSYEFVLIGQKPGAACRWFDDTKTVENIIRINKILPRKNEHSTEKPVELSAHFIKLHTKVDDIVLDPFMGSASTGVACVELGRKFIGIDIDPKWYDLARRRIEAVYVRGYHKREPLLAETKAKGFFGDI
jgi:site-specific DNA-methyltransferase (adenine-specific)